MGINGLFPLLKSIHRCVNLKKFEGQTIAVDAYGWLHRGTVACAMELALGKPTRKFVDFSMHRVRMLQHFGVIPFLVFDGDYLPSKAATETDRAKRRDKSNRAGLELLSAGKTSQAYLEFQKAVDVTPEMARQLIDELKKAGVQYIVAPYEADAQMVYLERHGIVSGILSEDSDLLVFGAKCLLTKLDQYGNCVEINKADFCACKEITLTGWSDKEFRQMAILSGCDYLASINNMGLKTAYRMVRKHKSVEKVLRMLQFDGKFFVPKGYLEAFYEAELTFLHQRVFCPKSLSLVLHTQPETPIDEDSMPYIGAYIEPDIAQGVARGDLNPMTKLPIVVKRNVPRSISAPWILSRSQLQRSASTPIVKKGKPLDTFFKAKRIPLAELDPNCFTPSPTQEQALRRNSGPWAAIPTPRPYLANPNAAAESVTRSAPPLRVQITNVISRTPVASEPRPPKRARLCADIDMLVNLSSGTKANIGRSRFFTSSAPEPSPTVGRTTRSKRAKRQDINIFSDDSVEEAMRELPDFDGFSNKVTVYQAEKETVLSEMIDEASGSEETVPTDATLTNAGETSSLATSTPETSSDDIIAPKIHSEADAMVAVNTASSGKCSSPTKTEPSLETPSAPPVSSMKDFESRFSFDSPVATPKSISIHSSTPRPSRIPLAVKSSITAAKSFSTASSAKPRTTLERLRDNAAGRNRLPPTPPMTPIFSQNPSVRRPLLASKRSVPFPEVEQVANVDKCMVDPASVPLPTVDDAENAALSLGSGSEDLIVHDSEGEDECVSPGGDSGIGLAARFTFEQFVFAG